MRGLWNTENVRAAENKLLATTSEGALMRRAAFAVATTAVGMLKGRRRVALLVGPGNNGGDALYAGYYLRRRGITVTAVIVEPGRFHFVGLGAFLKAGGKLVDEVPEVDLVIDGIVGLQGRGPLRPRAAEIVAGLNAPVLSIDLPSGIDPDTGAIDGPSVRAATTVVLGCRKPVHGLADCGELKFVDLGFHGVLPPPSLMELETLDVSLLWPVPGPHDDKYTQGVTGIAAGSATYPGAAVLSTGAAVLATSGMVRYAGPAADGVRARWPESICTGAITDAGRVQAWVVGPGLGTGLGSESVLRFVLEAGVPVCADADAITMLANNPDLWDARDPETPVVLTPHDGEYARLMGRPVGPDRVAAARDAALATNSVVLLKGNSTVIAAPDGGAMVHRATSSWPATAGSGDVLSGLIGSLLAAGVYPLLAAAAAAHVHSLAAELAARGAPIPASALMEAVPDAIRAVRAVTP
jgi:hydroxyethylthiazole kinase-like uncharacterized protein yjeF